MINDIAENFIYNPEFHKFLKETIYSRKFQKSCFSYICLFFLYKECKYLLLFMVILDNIFVKTLPKCFSYFIIVLQTKMYFQQTSTIIQVLPSISWTLELHMTLNMLSTSRKGNFCNILLSQFSIALLLECSVN